MSRRSRRFREHWHDRTVALPDDDVLRYVVMDEPAPPRLECPRTGRLGAIWPGKAMAMLAELDHPDARLRVPSDERTFGPGVAH